MQTIHQKISDYIHGKLSDEEVDQLWMNFLHQPVWYDYFITELTAKNLLSPGYLPSGPDGRPLLRIASAAHSSHLQK